MRAREHHHPRQRPAAPRDADARRRRERAKRKASFRVVEPTNDADDFAASVERDLASLPTTEDEYRR